MGRQCWSQGAQHQAKHWRGRFPEHINGLRRREGPMDSVRQQPDAKLPAVKMEDPIFSSKLTFKRYLPQGVFGSW